MGVWGLGSGVGGVRFADLVGGGEVGFGTYDVGFGVWGLGLGGLGWGVGVWGLGFGVWGVGCRMYHGGVPRGKGPRVGWTW